MKSLNLTADTAELQLIKEYLQDNASDILADKINNGTPFEKDGKQLINKKNLKGFMQFAADEAKKLVEKNARYACIEDKTVFGWAIHYFEEDSIEGNLFYMDGTEYKPVQKQKHVSAPVVKAKEETKTTYQFSLFDHIDEKPTEIEEEEPAEELDNAIKGRIVTEDGEIIDYEDFDGDSEDEPEAEPEDYYAPLQEPMGDPLYQRYKRVQGAYPDSVIAMRLGDFYEIYGSPAISLATELDATLTSRNVGLAGRLPMIGFPYHCADKYIKAINAKYNLVVIETKDDKDTQYLPKNIRKPDIPSNIDNPFLSKLNAIFGNDLEVVK